MNVSTRSTFNATGQLLRLPLRQDELAELMKEAEKRELDLETFIVGVLREYGKAEVGALLISAEDRRDIQRTLGRNFDNRSPLAKYIKRLAEVSVAGLTISLPENILQRLKSRCIRQPDFRAWLEQTVITELRRFVGL